MKSKEIIIAIVFGLLIAFGLTFFVYISQNQSEVAPIASASPTPLAALPEKTLSPLSLLQPENEAVFEDKALVITGTTFPNLPVVIFVNQKDFFTTSDAQGNFSLDVNLESGSNLIVATTVDDSGLSHSDQRLVVYTNKSLEETLVSPDEVKAEAKSP